MLCPGCANEMETLSVLGMDESFRCPNCGGFWVQNWVVNALSEGKPAQPTPMEGKPAVGGTNSCPTDGWILNSPPREVVPEGFVAGVCNACRNWWLPGNSLFTYADAAKAKKSYENQWHKDVWKKTAFPALVMLLAIGAVTGSVVLVRQQQRVKIGAADAIEYLSVVYVVPGGVDIWFKTSTPMPYISYRSVTDLHTYMAPVVIEDGKYVVHLRELAPGDYIYTLFGRDYQFRIELY